MKQALYGFIAFIVTFLLVSFAFAQDATTTTIAVMTSTTVPAWIAKGNSILDMIVANKAIAGTVGTILLDLIMRLVKTKEPKSLLYLVSNGFKMLAKAAELMAKGAELFSGFLDQYIQRLKDDDKKPQ